MQISGISGSGSDAYSVAKMIEEMRNRIFEKDDADGDGQLSSTELTNLAEKTGQQVATIMDRYDTDQDGAIGTEEAIQLAEDMDAAMRTRMNLHMFEEMDENDDDVLDADELAELAQKTGLTAEEILTQYDSNGDGKIDADESATMLEELRPKGPPPPPPPEETSSDTGDETEGQKMLDSLLEAIKESDDEETTENLLKLYTQTIIEMYNVDQSGSAAGSLLNENA